MSSHVNRTRSGALMRAVALCGLLAVACAPAAAPAPTAAPPKPVLSGAEGPAATASAKPTQAPAAKPAEKATPQVAPKPAASPAAKADAKPAAKADWQAEWEKTVAAAKQEGKVVVSGPPGESYRRALTAFQRTYPDIQVELTGSGGADFAPKVLAERQGGQYLWDLFISGSSTGYTQLIPRGALDPLPPTFIRPEVADDSKWTRGFDDGWADNAKQYIYLFVAVNNWTAYINRQMLPESQLNSLDQIMTDPKFKGQIAMHDPRPAGAGSRVLGTLLHGKGEEALRKMLTQQEVVFTRDGRQLTEWVVRGRYPIAIAISPDQFEEFQRQGVNLDHVKPLMGNDPALFGLNSGFGSLMLLNRAPHPNAAKVYINWLLSPEGQTVYSKDSNYNSRRTDVPVVDPERAVDPKIELVNLAKEKENHWRERAQQIANELIK